MKQIIADPTIIGTIEEIIQTLIDCFKNGNKVLLCGNGGSAADAQHIAAELSGKFYLDRPPLYAEALHVNSSYLTAVANDIGVEKLFSRALCAKGKEGDILIAISTSGNSLNVLKAIEKAKEKKIKTIALTGAKGKLMAGQCDHSIIVPSSDTARIQEVHILIGHILCQKIEESLFGNLSQ